MKLSEIMSAKKVGNSKIHFDELIHVLPFTEVKKIISELKAGNITAEGQVIEHQPKSFSNQFDLTGADQSVAAHLWADWDNNLQNCYENAGSSFSLTDPSNNESIGKLKLFYCEGLEKLLNSILGTPDPLIKNKGGRPKKYDGAFWALVCVTMYQHDCKKTSDLADHVWKNKNLIEVDLDSYDALVDRLSPFFSKYLEVSKKIS